MRFVSLSSHNSTDNSLYIIVEGGGFEVNFWDVFVSSPVLSVFVSNYLQKNMKNIEKTVKI